MLLPYLEDAKLEKRLGKVRDPSRIGDVIVWLREYKEGKARGSGWRVRESE